MDNNNKPKKIVTGLYFLTILGYVAVGLLTVFSGYLLISYLFGAFNRPNIELSGLQFKETEITISKTAGTAEVTLVSPDGILQEQLSEQEENKDKPKAVYNVADIEISLQDDKGRVFKEKSPIQLPNKSDIHLGVPFTVQANLDDDNFNIGGDCYLLATVTSTDDKVYSTRTALHIFVDVGIEKIDSIVVSPTINDGEDTIVQGDNGEDKSNNRVTSTMFLGDEVVLSVNVTPARALSPHTAQKYKNVDSVDYVKPKELSFDFSNKDYFSALDNSKIAFNQVVQENESNPNCYVTVKVNSWYDKANTTSKTRTVFFNGIAEPTIGDFDISGVVNEKELNVDLTVASKQKPVLAFIAKEATLPENFEDTEKQNALSRYNELKSKNKVINLDVKVQNGSRKSFNALYPSSLQSNISSFDVTYSSIFPKGTSKPEWITKLAENSELNCPIQIKKVLLGSTDVDPYVWFVYVTRESEPNETVKINFDYVSSVYTTINQGVEEESEKSYAKACSVLVNTTPVNQTDVGWANMFSTISALYDDGKLNCEITKEDDTETVIDTTPIEFTLNSNLANSTATYTRLIYLVKQDEVLNSVNCHKVKVDSQTINFNNENYSMLLQETDNNNTSFKIKPVGGGIVTIQPYLIKTNVYGEPIDPYYNVINKATKAVLYGNTASYSANSYVIIPVSKRENSAIQPDSLVITVTEKLTGFRFYDSIDFVEPVDKLVVDGSTKFFVLGNSSLALTAAMVKDNFKFYNGDSEYSADNYILYPNNSSEGRTYLTVKVDSGITNLSVKYEPQNVSTQKDVKSVSGLETKTIVFKVNGTYFNNTAVALSETALDTGSISDNFQVYLENAYAVKPFYQAGSNGDEVRWHSTNINVAYLLCEDYSLVDGGGGNIEQGNGTGGSEVNPDEGEENPENEDPEEGGTETEGISQLFAVDGESETPKTKSYKTYKLASDKSFFLKDCISQWIAGSVSQWKGDDYSEYKSSLERILGIKQGEGLSGIGVTDKVSLYNGMIYKIDDSVIDDLNGKSGTFYKLYCVAYDMNGESLGNVAFLDISYVAMPREAEKTIELNSYTVDNVTHCTFDINEVLLYNNVKTKLASDLDEHTQATFDVLFNGSEYFSSGNLTNGNTFDLIMSGTRSGNMGTIKTKCTALRGVYVGNVFTAVKETVEGQSQPASFDIEITYKLHLQGQTSGSDS